MLGGNRLRVVMVTIVAGIILIFAGLSWYKYQYSMEIIAQQEYNEGERVRVLVASQGSEFKAALADELIKGTVSKSIHVKLIDVTRLDKVNESKWDAIIIIHSWEYFKPEKNTKSFVKSLPSKEKLILVTTSADGKLGMKNVDGVSCASSLAEVGDISDKILNRLVSILSLKE